MKRSMLRSIIIQSIGIWLGVLGVGLVHAAEFILLPTPDEGLQPRLVMDEAGNIHLLYFRKRLNTPQAREGDLYYRQYLPDEGRFSARVRVSSQSYNLQSVAIARAALAVDGEGRAHALWYLPRQSRFYYARSNTERTEFESQRSMVSQYTDGIDAGGDVAARGQQVAITWGAGDLSREDARTVFARFSNDGGATFSEELVIGDRALGACACCSMAAAFTPDERLLIAYRSAIDSVGRHMQLLQTQWSDSTLTPAVYGVVHPWQQWELSACPLSTNDIAEASSQPWLVFETAYRIVQMALPGGLPEPVAEPAVETRQKNPAIAINGSGEHLIAWGESISHTRGGRLQMQLMTGDGPAAEFTFTQQIEIPEFSFPAVATLPNGDFLVLY